MGVVEEEEALRELKNTLVVPIFSLRRSILAPRAGLHLFR